MGDFDRVVVKDDVLTYQHHPEPRLSLQQLLSGKKHKNAEMLRQNTNLQANENKSTSATFLAYSSNNFSGI